MNHIGARNKFLLTIAMVACYAMIFIDESGVAVTLPMMQQALSLSNNSVHWVINSYLLSLSILLLLGGKLADIYGQRNVFSIGIGFFLLASIVCASAQSTWVLIAGRLLQGVGASLLMPCITVMVRRSFAENEFGKVYGSILGFSNFFYALGPFIAGVLTQYASWRWFFGANIPVGLVCLVFTFIAVAPDDKQNTATFSDIKGLITFIATLTALVFATMQGATWGWGDAWIVSLLILAALGLWLFIKIELSAKDPLLDLRLFQNKYFFAGNLVLFCASICLTIMVFWALWLQISAGFSPATVGLALLPATITFIFIPALAGAWQDKSGARPPMLLGSGLILFGVVWMIATISLQNYWWLCLGLFAFGLGIPLAIPSSVTTIMKSVTENQQGMASGTFTTIRQLALTLGIAILSAVITSYDNLHISRLLASSSEYANISLHQVNRLLVGKSTLNGLNLGQLSELKQAAAAINTQALIYAMMVVGLFAAIACVVTLVLVRKRP